MFLDAAQRWHPAQAGLSEMFLALTERCAAVETDIRQNAPMALRAEFFPEVAEALTSSVVATAQAAPLTTKPPAPVDADETTRTLYFLMLIMQVMEDAWVGAQLDLYWSHPLNDGWMNYFQRWASTPSFRRWWPILRPIYGNGFREFVKERFDLRVRDTFARNEPPGIGAHLELRKVQNLNGFAFQQWALRYGVVNAEIKYTFQYVLQLEGEPRLHPIQVGFVTYRVPEEGIVEWNCSALFVPHALIGAGIIARFLDALIHYFFETMNVSTLRVILDGPAGLHETPAGPPGSDTAASVAASPSAAPASSAIRPRDRGNRQALNQTINFYKSRFFAYERDGEETTPRRLVRKRKLSAPEATVPLAASSVGK